MEQIKKIAADLNQQEQRQEIVKKVSESYSDIELTQEEIEIALAKGREEKYYAQKREAYVKKVYEQQKPFEQTYDEWTQTRLMKADLIVNGKFEFNEFRGLLFADMSKYFYGIETDRFNLRKGILLIGAIGCGKTTFLKIFTENPFASYMIESCRDISYDYSKDGKITIETYSKQIIHPPYYNKYRHEYLGVCFDDLGTETNKKYFGNESNVLADILLNRYDRIPFKHTHITTNLNAEQIEENYGARLRSRFREMFNVIEFPSTETDLRK